MMQIVLFYSALTINMASGGTFTLKSIFQQKKPEISELAINWNYAEHCIMKAEQKKWRKSTVFIGIPNTDCWNIVHDKLLAVNLVTDIK
jgi:hypothetical protein